MDLAKVVNLLWYGSIALLALLWLRLLISGLWRAYPAFTLYIFSLWAESLVLLAFSGRQSDYGRAWILSRLVVLLFEVIAVLAVFGRWTVNFPGIGAFGRRLVVVLMAVSVGVSLTTLPVKWSASGWMVAYQLTTVANRATNLCCSFFLLLTIGFFYKFGGPVAPNLKRHSWTMAAFVTANAVSYFVLSSHAFILANILLPSVSLAALAFWLFALSRQGELQPISAVDENEWAAAEEINDQLQKLADSVALTPRGLSTRVAKKRN